ncbi:sigma-70 family RNA polymerase sigma factor [Terricaulis sp.]|uniref:sigma-70 family RNA polymerase sigma factor n=1 Tax=Terricaulis sp. TaxID=2768686 RepID=UPI00378353DD
MSEALTFEPHRGRLTGLAYRMLGSRADAEDVVQDAFLRWSHAPRDDVANPEAYLTRITTRLCIDRLKSAQARREVYVGPWLPEPVLDADALSPHSHAELADDLSFALLLALDRLTPAERAAFLLHDVFDAPFSEVAETLEKSEAACRQLAARARKAVRGAHGEPRPPQGEHERLLAAFAQAASSGDLSDLKALLAEHVVTLSDGGGRKSAALNPIFGADKTARFILGIRRKIAESEVTVSVACINGAPGLLVYLDGALDQAQTIAVENGRIAALYIVRNPDKLAALTAGLSLQPDKVERPS